MAIRPNTSLVARKYYLPRLAPVFYQADAVVHWEMSVAHRRTGWLTPIFHCAFREIMVHTGARHGLLCPVYCLMPDHIHLVWMGLRLDSDQLVAITFLRTYLGPLLSPAKMQHQPYDHVHRLGPRLHHRYLHPPRRAPFNKSTVPIPTIAAIPSVLASSFPGWPANLGPHPR